MTRRRDVLTWSALIGAAGALVGIILLELRQGLPDSEAMLHATATGQPAPAVPLSSPLPGSETDQAMRQAAQILARPLFSPGRRPVAASAGPASGTVLPRMTGVVVTPEGSRAIFAGPGGKPVVVEVGGQIGLYAVRAINAGQVTLSGPDGTRVVYPKFEPRAPTPPAAGGLPGLPGLPGLSGLALPGLGGPAPPPVTGGSPGPAR